MERMAQFVVQRRRLVLLIASFLLIVSVFGVVGTRINYDILSYLPSELESMEGESYLEDDFHIASTAMLTVEGMQTADLLDMKEDLEQINGVSNVFWVSDVVDVMVPESMLPDDIKNLMYGENESTMLLVRFDDVSASDSTMAAIEQIKWTMRKDCFLGGMSVVLEDTKQLINQELPKYVLCSVVLSMIILFLFMSNTVVPLIFMVGLLFPIVYNFGSNIFLGEISFITQALAAVLQLGVTMDFSIFLLHRYQEEKVDKSNESAMVAAICRTSTAITASSLTTIAGFLAMCTMSLKLGSDIGIVMAKGVALGVLSTLTILPALIIYFDRAIENHTHPTIKPRMGRMTGLIARRPKTILVLFLVLFVVFGRAQSLTNVYYTLTDSLPQDLTGIAGINKLEEDFNMPSVHFVVVDESLNANDMKNLANDLDAVEGVNLTLCYEKYVGAGIPQSALPEEISSIFHANGHKLMMISTEYKPGTDEMGQQLGTMNDIIKRYDANGVITGEGAMTRDLITTSDRDFKMTSIASILAVFIIVLITFKSISIPILLVAAIEGAIMINLGLSYFTGSTIPFISSIVIGTIQLGATVDYAILMTTRFREECNNGLKPLQAVTVAVDTCAPSIITSGLTFFAATVGVSLVSKIDLIRSLCTLISRGALISMVVILLVLPALLVLFAPTIQKTTYRWLDNPAKTGTHDSKERV